MVKQKTYRSKLFSKDDLLQIKNTVAKVEKLTSGQIVNLVVARSDPYHSLPWVGMIVGWIAATIILALVSMRSGLEWPTHTLFEIQLCGSLGLGILATLPPFLRFFISKKEAAINVHRECLANFTAVGLHETRAHNGVLIYISELERRVQILGDSGIHQKVEKEFWDAQVGRILSGIRKGKSAQGLCEAIEVIGKHLADHFPPSPEDQNELPDEVLLGDRSLNPDA